MEDTIVRIALLAIPLLAAVVLHEVAHGYVAYRLGDPTAHEAGRLTLNPIAHIDPMGTIVVPLMLALSGTGFLFGWAKPVPVNPYRLREPRKHGVMVAAAGPLANFAVATVSALALHGLLAVGASEGAFSETVVQPLAVMAYLSIRLNVMLAVFNLLPIPPLDGGRVLSGLVPPEGAALLHRVEPYGFLILIVLLMSDALNVVLGPVIGFFLSIFLGGSTIV